VEKAGYSVEGLNIYLYENPDAEGGFDHWVLFLKILANLPRLS
jgi:hypothetical protein